ncbi:putative Ig domain-containing protein, partial [Streptococcus dentiloxodontae]
TVTATDSAGHSTSQAITITVQRDTDGDGTPDVTDSDDDNDGILDSDDKHPKVADSSAPVISASDATIVEHTAVSLPVSASDEDDATVEVSVSGLPTGLSHDASTNQITGSASGENWTSDTDESHAYTVTVTATDSAGHSTSQAITITVQRDTDGDGTPDVTDSDDDNDGILDKYDHLPKTPNAMTQMVNIELYYLKEGGNFFVKEILTGISNGIIQTRVYVAPDGYHFDPSSIFVDPVEYTLSEDNKILTVFGTFDDSFNPEGEDTQKQWLRAVLIKDEVQSVTAVNSDKEVAAPDSEKETIQTKSELPNTGESSNNLTLAGLALILASLGIYVLDKKKEND